VNTVHYDVTLHFVVPKKTFLDILPDLVTALLSPFHL
jgi:hypothetical protein